MLSHPESIAFILPFVIPLFFSSLYYSLNHRYQFFSPSISSINLAACAQCLTM